MYIVAPFDTTGKPAEARHPGWCSSVSSSVFLTVFLPVVAVYLLVFWLGRGYAEFKVLVVMLLAFVIAIVACQLRQCGQLFAFVQDFIAANQSHLQMGSGNFRTPDPRSTMRH